jgi:hypothetical protein
LRTLHVNRAIAPTPSPEEAAAIVAALECFIRATAPPRSQPALTLDGWQRAALQEGVERGPHGDLRDPWINT